MSTTVYTIIAPAHAHKYTEIIEYTNVSVYNTTIYFIYIK